MLRAFWEFLRDFFFHHFSCFSQRLFLRFWLHFRSQNGSQIDKKSMKNRCRNWIGKLHSFGTDFSSIFHGFSTPFYVEKTAKTMDGCSFFMFSRVLLQDLFQIVLWSFRHRFFFNFGYQSLFKTPPKTCLKNR